MLTIVGDDQNPSRRPVESIVPDRKCATAASTFDEPSGAAAVKSPTRVTFRGSGVEITPPIQR